MLIELPRQRKQSISKLRLLCPIGKHLVLFFLADLSQPHCAPRAGNQDDVWNIARSQAPADRQMNPLQQSPVLPLLLQPRHWHFGVSLVCLPTATAIADTDLAEHEALGRDRALFLRFHK